MRHAPMRWPCHARPRSRTHARTPQVRGKEPAGEIQMYTWMDANLRELSDLIKEVRGGARDGCAPGPAASLLPAAACQQGRVPHACSMPPPPHTHTRVQRR